MTSRIEALRAQVEEKLNRRDEALEEARRFRAYGYNDEAEDRRYEAQVLLNEVYDLEEEIAEAEAYALTRQVEVNIEVEVEANGRQAMTYTTLYEATREAQRLRLEASREFEAYDLLADDTWAQVEALEAEQTKHSWDDIDYDEALRYAYDAYDEAMESRDRAEDLVQRLQEEIDLLRRLADLMEERGAWS